MAAGGEPASRHLDRRIVEAVQGYTEDDPQDLAGILHHVDYRERLVLTRDELSDGLRRLIHAGRIREVVPRGFIAAEDSFGGAFRGLSAAEHDEACDVYHQRFRETYRNL